MDFTACKRSTPWPDSASTRLGTERSLLKVARWWLGEIPRDQELFAVEAVNLMSFMKAWPWKPVASLRSAENLVPAPCPANCHGSAPAASRHATVCREASACRAWTPRRDG